MSKWTEEELQAVCKEPGRRQYGSTDPLAALVLDARSERDAALAVIDAVRKDCQAKLDKPFYTNERSTGIDAQAVRILKILDGVK